MINLKTLMRVIVFTLCIFLSLMSAKSQSSSLKIAQKRQQLFLTHDSITMVNCLDTLGVLYQYKKLDSSYYFAIQAQTLARRIHFLKGEGMATGLIGVTLYLRGLNKEALNTLTSAIKICQQVPDSGQIALDLISMANVYGATQDTVMAKNYMRHALQIAYALPQIKTAGLVYTSYCIYTLELSKDSVNYYLDKAEKIAQHFQYKDLSLLILQERIIRQLMAGDFLHVLDLIGQSLSLSKNADLDFFEINSYILYTEYYNSVNKLDSALFYQNNLYALLKKQGYEFLKVPALKTLLQLTTKEGNPQKIIQVQQWLTDALTTENHNLQKFVVDYLVYNNIQTDNQILSVTHKSDLLKMWLFVGLFAASMAAGLLIYKYYRLSSRLNREITQQNAQMLKALNDLEQSHEQNNQLMKVVAHDLRNPIGGMSSVASFMLNNADRPEDDRIMLEIIKTSGENSLNLVNNLLQTHSQTEELKREPVDMAELLKYCVALLKHKADAKKQRITLQAEPLVLPVNREKLWRIISNLIANAIKFSPTESPIFVKLERDADYALISVQDKGIGIPKEMADKIFDMFTTVKRPGTDGEQPFGMGLAICKQIAEAHGGKLWFESKPSEGSVFYVKLPIT